MSALYRTYRPQDLTHVVGQRHVVQTLGNAIGAMLGYPMEVAS